MGSGLLPCQSRNAVQPGSCRNNFGEYLQLVGTMPLQPVKKAAEGADLASMLAMPALSLAFLEELWQISEAAAWSISREEFAATLLRIGEAQHYGASSETPQTPDQKMHFLRNLKLTELALAQGCVFGHEA